MRRKKLIVTGYLGRCPIAGVVWQHLHYLVGLQKLGHEVYYIEDSTAHPYNPRLGEYSADFTENAAMLEKLARQFGFEHRWGFRARYLPERPTAGLSGEKIDALFRECDAILNVCGEQELNEDLLQNPALIYIESDPGKEQCLLDTEPGAPIGETLRQYRAIFTFGENIGTPHFPVPLHDFRWLPTRQPIVTELWTSARPPEPEAVFTTIANWNTKGKDVEWQGDRYLWSKALEFLRFRDAPRVAGEKFEIATNLSDPLTREDLLMRGWQLRSPDELSLDHDLYRRYIQGSKGEFTVAKDQYVRLNTGWFSDRTACYLAVGRPVITQETGFTRLFGGEAGLLAFSSLDEIAEHLRRVNLDYAHHCRAAQDLACEHFEATKVLADLLERAGI